MALLYGPAVHSVHATCNHAVKLISQRETFFRETSEGEIDQQPEPMRLPPPSPAAITRMEEALLWLRWLEADDAKLVFARADRTPWKAICWQFGIARATAHRRWQYGLSVIAWRLNGRSWPRKRSKQYLVTVA
jgi:hypothetical protein